MKPLRKSVATFGIFESRDFDCQHGTQLRVYAHYTKMSVSFVDSSRWDPATPAFLATVRHPKPHRPEPSKQREGSHDPSKE